MTSKQTAPEEMAERPTPKLFLALVEWATSAGAESIKDIEGCWNGETDEYFVKFNGHGEERENIPPYSALIESKKTGWPVAIVGPSGGCTMMGGDEHALTAHFSSLSDEGGGE